jgi:hypothetical protein
MQTTQSNTTPGAPIHEARVVQFRNQNTQECFAVTVPHGERPWEVLAKRKARSLGKGHVWIQLKPVDPARFDVQ